MNIWKLEGISLKRGADPDLIFQLDTASGVIDLWELYEPVIETIRKRIEVPLHMKPLEYLHNEAKKRHPEIRRPQYEMDNPRFKST